MHILRNDLQDESYAKRILLTNFAIKHGDIFNSDTTLFRMILKFLR